MSAAAVRKVADTIAWRCPFPYADVLALCVAQVSSGRGEERHGGRTPFIRQPWVALQLKHSIGFLTGQAEKKWIEARKLRAMKGEAWYVSEVTGAIVYSLMALIALIDPEIANQKMHPRRERLSAQEWFSGVWPTEDVLDSYNRAPQPRESPAYALQQRPVLIRLIHFQVFTMAKALRECLAGMDLPMVVPPLTLPLPELTERVG